MKYKTLDSGKRIKFISGMNRDTQEGKPRFDLIYPPLLKRWAEILERGATKYGERNWQKAKSQEEFDRFKASSWRHFYSWINGLDKEEDHAAALLFNIAAIEYMRDKYEGKMSDMWK